MDKLKFMQSVIGKPMKNSPSPVANWLQGTILEATETSLTVQYLVREEMANPAKILHGGIICTMFDDTMGAMIYVTSEEYFYPSVNLSTDFISIVQVGETVRVKAEVIRKGKTVIVAEAKMYNAQEKLIAKCSSNFVKSSIKV